MDRYRKIRKIIKSQPVIEGAGVHLNRAVGNRDVELYDPFLLLDDFRSNNPRDYEKGFPWHPHRGIETITYVLSGSVEHGDSLGNKGIIAKGEVQWMTAGSGIIHQEMPKGNEAHLMEGFQLWANLSKKDKMINPRYQEIKEKEIPEITTENNVKIKLIAGSIGNVNGAVNGIAIDPEYFDIKIPENTFFELETNAEKTAFIYCVAGSLSINNEDRMFENGTVVLFDNGEKISFRTKLTSARLLFISGKPLKEPIAWSGPIVMNTREEMEQAYKELEEGTFLKT